ncbi:MAG TPA: hypothetical protein VD908_04345 [Cytophagales bacterium]|nr:hypothetical protein [Cytophagales bacterium]
MKRIIEKFYGFIFAEKDDKEATEVPYANKVFMFYFTIIVTAVVLFLIIADIVKNIEKISPTPGQ